MVSAKISNKYLLEPMDWPGNQNQWKKFLFCLKAFPVTWLILLHGSDQRKHCWRTFIAVWRQSVLWCLNRCQQITKLSPAHTQDSLSLTVSVTLQKRWKKPQTFCFPKYKWVDLVKAESKSIHGDLVLCLPCDSDMRRKTVGQPWFPKFSTPSVRRWN